MQKEILRKYWFEILLAVVVMGVHLYAAASDALNFPSSWFTRDDAYYYFKVAQNLTEGKGLTFDGINVSNGYHPLWMLVNLPIFALARFDLILPLRILLLLQGAFSAGTAILIYRIAREAISQPLGMLLAGWWAFDLYNHSVMYEYGLETGIASLATALLLYRLFLFERSWRSRPPSLRDMAALALFALFAMFSRLDLVFLAALAGLWIILRGTPMRALLLLDLLLAAAAVFASFTVRLGFPDYYSYTRAALLMASLSAVTKATLYFLLGLYQPVQQRPFSLTARQIAMAVSLSTLLTGAVMLAASSLLGGFPRAVLLVDWILNLAGMLVLRLLWRLFTQNSEADTRAPIETLRQSWKKWLREAAAYYATLGIPLLLYMLFNRLVVGTAMPVSGQIKRWWGEGGSRSYGGSARNPLAFWSAQPDTEFNAWNPLTAWLNELSLKLAEWFHAYRNDEIYIGLLLLVCLAGMLILLLRRKRVLRAAVLASLPLLLSASVLQVLSYNALGYSAMKEWYWISQPLFLVFALGLLLWIPLRRFLGAQWILATLLVLGLALNFAAVTVVRMPYGAREAGAPYMDSVAFLEENTPAGSMIGMTGGGNVGYYIKDRTIVNMDGLINSPAYFEALKNRAGNQYLLAIGMDYIFANPTILEGTPYFGQFQTGAELGRFGGKSLLEFAP